MGSTPPERTPPPAGGQRRSGPQPPSVIASDLVVTGDLASEGEIIVDGAVRGDVKAERLVVGVGGRIEGRIKAASLEVYGEIRGDVDARLVRLYKSARLHGDLMHEELSIEAGAAFAGRSIRADAESPVALSLPEPLAREAAAA